MGFTQMDDCPGLSVTVRWANPALRGRHVADREFFHHSQYSVKQSDTVSKRWGLI